MRGQTRGLNDSELIGTMYLSLKSLIGWIMTTPTLIVLFKIRLVSISLQFIDKNNLQTPHVYNTLNTIPIAAGGSRTDV